MLNCKSLSLFIVLAASASSQAFAETSWQVGSYNNAVDIQYKADFKYDGLYAIANTPDDQTIILTCSERYGLKAMIALEPIEISDIFESKTRRLKGRQVDLSLAGGTAKKDQWAYDRPSQTLSSVKKWQAQRIYNGIASGRDIEMDINRIGKVSLTPPPVDDEFKLFVTSCPAFGD